MVSMSVMVGLVYLATGGAVNLYKNIPPSPYQRGRGMKKEEGSYQIKYGEATRLL
jgi:hypothetical protein